MKVGKQQPRLNLKFLIGLLLVGAVLWLAVGGWHKRQVRISTKQLLERGMAAKQANNHRLAVEELGRYVDFAPDDTDALAEYTDSLYKVGSTKQLREKVFALNEVVLRRRPDEMKIRAIQAELALDLGRIPDAASTVDTIEKQNKTLSAGLWHIRGRCHEAMRETDKAIESYEQALVVDANHLEATERLADLLSTRPGESARADKLLSDLVKRTGSVDALLLRARRHATAKNQDAALGDLREAVALAPDNSVAVSALGAAIHRAISVSGESPKNSELRDVALGSLREQMPRDAENTAMRLYFARLLWMEEEDRAEAIDTLREGCELAPNDETVLFSLVDSLISLNQLDDAESLLPGFSQEQESAEKKSLLRARMMMARGEWNEAAARLSTLLISVPRDPQVLNQARIYQADCLRESQEDAAAAAATAAAYEKTLEQNPGSTAARLGLAESYLKNDQLVSAINQYRRLKIIPRVAAFLADLLIEAQTTDLAEAGRWEEILRLVNAQDGTVHDPVERTILRTDMLFARGKTREALQTLIDARERYPDRKEFSLALDQATALLLDRVVQRATEMQYDPAANAGFAMVVDHWATRSDNRRLTQYFEQFISTAAERDDVVQRMELSTFLAGRLALGIEKQSGKPAKELRAYASDLSVRLIGIAPSRLGQRLQLLAEFGQTPAIFSELEAVQEPVIAGTAVAQLVPSFYGNDTVLDQLSSTLTRRLSTSPKLPALLNAQALLLSAKGEHDQAIDVWRSLNSEFPDNVSYAGSLGRLLAVHASDSTESRPIVARALKLAPKNASLIDAMACVQIAAGELQAAEKTLKALTINNTHLPHLVHLAYTQAIQRKTGEAVFTLNKIFDAGLRDGNLHPLDRIIVQRLTEGLRE